MFLHCAPSEVDQLPAADFDLLCRYFQEEPWGPWRDNMHAAIIAREVRRTRLKNPRTPIELDQFLLIDPEKRRVGHLSGFVDALRGMAGGIRKHVSEVAKRPIRRRRKKGGPQQ